MKKLATLLFLVLLPAMCLGAANDIIVPQRNAANTQNVERRVTGAANSLIGFDGSSILSRVTIGSGLTLSGGTLTASGGAGSGDMLAANNLSDLASVPTARTNLSVFSIAQNAGVSVAYYGALGTGTSSAGGTGGAGGDTEYIQAALSSSYGHIYVPPGTYWIKSTLTIPSNKRLTLAPGATMLRVGNGVTAMLRNAADGSTGGYTANSNIIVEGGVWDGNSATYTENASIIAFGHATDVVVRDCKIQAVPGWHAIEFNGVKNGIASRVRFNGVPNEAIQPDLMSDSGAFPWFGPYDSTKAQNILVTDCVFDDVQTAVGSHNAPSCDGLTIARCVMNATSGKAIKAIGFTRLAIVDNQFIGCSTAIDAHTTDVTTGFTISGNKISDSSAAAIVLTYWTNGAVTHNVITGGVTTITGAGASVVVRDNIIDGVRSTITSAQLAAELSDENGSGKALFAAGTLAISSGKTGTFSNTLTFTGTDGSTVAFGAGGTVLYSGGALGTPSSATLTNATGLPVATGISGLGTGVATWLATASSANLRAAMSDETGTGALFFANGDIGAATGTSLTLSGAFETTGTALGFTVNRPGATDDAAWVLKNTTQQWRGYLIGADSTFRLYDQSNSVYPLVVDAGALSTGGFRITKTADVSGTTASLSTQGGFYAVKNITAGGNLAAANLSLAAAFTTSGANALTLTTTGTTNVTLPTTGTLATRAGAETLSNKIYLGTTSAIAASDIDWSLSNTHTKTLSANTTFTFSNMTAGQTITVAVTNTASNYTVTWPTVSWTGGSAPTQTTGAKLDIYTFIRIGSTTFGSAVQNLTP